MKLVFCKSDLKLEIHVFLVRSQLKIFKTLIVTYKKEHVDA